MKILGIDPGTVVMGYGVIENDGDEIALVDFGAIKVPEHSEMGERLSLLYNKLVEIINHHHPDAAAVESPFISKNVKSAMAIGRAQAVALLAAANCHVPAFEYPPAKVKQMVTNYGAGSRWSDSSSVWRKRPNPPTPPTLWPWLSATCRKPIYKILSPDRPAYAMVPFDELRAGYQLTTSGCGGQGERK
jgi:crossover junction endodeoxyribonuclease RuvC